MGEYSLERRLERLERALRLILHRLDVDEAEIEDLLEEIGQPTTYPQTVAIKVAQLP
jgi:hypothetical protein